MKNLRLLAVFFWYILCIYVVMAGIVALVTDWSKIDWLSRLAACLGLVLLVLFFVMIHLAVRELLTSVPPSPYVPATCKTRGEAFPSTATVWTGIWLLIVTAVSILALFWSLEPPPFLCTLLQKLFQVSSEVSSEVSSDTREALVMMFAAAVGSLITTILGYLDHASYKRDFDRAFVPWYIGRPLMGMLLGLVFYFILKGGLWTVTPRDEKPLGQLNLPGLSGIGALVGMFSRNAIEKLREFFHGIFRTEKDMAQKLVDSLPKDLQEQVKPHWQNILGNSVKPGAESSWVPAPTSSTPSPVPTPKPTVTPQI